MMAPGGLGTAGSDGPRGLGPQPAVPAGVGSAGLSPGRGCGAGGQTRLRPGPLPAGSGCWQGSPSNPAAAAHHTPARAVSTLGSILHPLLRDALSTRQPLPRRLEGTRVLSPPPGLPPRDLPCARGHRHGQDTGQGLSLRVALGKRGQRVEKRPLFAPRQHPVPGWGLSALRLWFKWRLDVLRRGKVAAEVGRASGALWGKKLAVWGMLGSSWGDARKSHGEGEEGWTAAGGAGDGDGKERRSGAILTYRGRGRETEAGEVMAGGTGGSGSGAAASRTWVRPGGERHMGDENTDQGSAMRVGFFFWQKAKYQELRLDARSCAGSLLTFLAQVTSKINYLSR